MLKAKDGRKQAHMDVLVAVPGKKSLATQPPDLEARVPSPEPKQN
ncbi:hypothetical protein D777_01553 [Marinobacter nitratireducens]|uniref:Uncharacterized protein n=1 Tax=Marinobacter nitratireducens TaxID=1137280 RepID=A0A072N3L6_9GAMM|nr:hypothetical protein D777_01553 [Marinobacter nitratireducens]